MRKKKNWITKYMGRRQLLALVNSLKWFVHFHFGTFFGTFWKLFVLPPCWFNSCVSLVFFVFCWFASSSVLRVSSHGCYVIQCVWALHFASSSLFPSHVIQVDINKLSMTLKIKWKENNKNTQLLHSPDGGEHVDSTMLFQVVGAM